MKLLVFFLTASSVAAQVLGGYRAQFENWLQSQARLHWDARDQAIAALASREDIAKRQAYIRQTALKLIGGLPQEKTPLNARVTASFVRDGYRVENLIFESQPGFRVTANLYLPTGKPGPHPAVLGVAGHSTNGKASSTYQRAFIGFVRRGIAVLAYDPPGQGERLEYFDPASGTSRVGIGVDEHLMAGVASLLTGQTIARHFVWDGVRAFDYLLTRPEIDPKRIAVAGNSGGGTQAAYLALFEPRLANAISSCYMTNWRELWSGPGPQDSEQIWPGFLSSGLDFGDFALALAPRPYLITSAIRDYFPINGARATFKQTLRLFDQIGGGSNLGFFEYDDTHGWSQPRREAASRWLEKHFFGLDSTGAEASVQTEEESQLYATATGHLSSSVGSRTMQQLSADRASELAAQRGKPSEDSIKKTVGWKEPSAVTSFERGSDGKTVELIVEGGVKVPGEFEIAANQKKIVILTGGSAASQKADREELLRHGLSVFTLYPRGSGREYVREGDSGYNLAYQIAARTWLLGRNLLQMQAADIAAAARYLQQTSPDHPIYVHAKGSLGPAALLAGALERKIDRVLVESSVLSLEAIVAAQIHHGWENAVAPGVLAHFDLSDLKAMMAPGSLLELSPVTPSGITIRNRKSGANVRLRGESWSLQQSIGAFFF